MAAPHLKLVRPTPEWRTRMLHVHVDVVYGLTVTGNLVPVNSGTYIRVYSCHAPIDQKSVAVKAYDREVVAFRCILHIEFSYFELELSHCNT